MNVFEVTEGDGPIILGQPHGGTHVPAGILARLNARGRALSDTDWHIHRLYDGLLDGITTVRSNIHRYVIDANRDPSGISLYPGQNTTSLCPTTDFDGEDIWEAGQAPAEDEILARRASYHTPYHEALAQQIERVQAKHGVAILYDCHSIRSIIPHLFEGELPVFNIGTDNGQTCHNAIESAAHETCLAAPEYDTVLNGRFRGGWTTRHYAHPAKGAHVIQMELPQRAYMDEASPWNYRIDRAETLRPILDRILEKLDQIARSGALDL
ncbi:MAG: N-formylglutamate deformylase [Rhodobacteraceae bacterium]|nr:N-formylglutamate deformylase [Paracoccaceae bacterium]